MKNIVIFGGSSGLAKKVVPYLDYDSISPLSSKECDVRDIVQVDERIKNSNIAIYFSVVNYDNLIANLKSDDLDHQLDVNIKGYLNVLQSAANNWKSTGGSIVYISSVLSSTPIKGTAVYSSCKSFCDTLTKVFAMENAKNNITCNSIQLGYFDGGLTYRVPEKVLENVKLSIPSRRLGDCQELADTINSVTSIKYLNGSIIKLTGGLQ